MILLGLVSLAIMFGMPYLVDNSELPPPLQPPRGGVADTRVTVDPEMRAEWEERQKSNPMNSIMGAASGQGGAGGAGSFDMAAFLAGSAGKKEGGVADAGAAPAGKVGNGGGEKRRKR